MKSNVKQTFNVGDSHKRNATYKKAKTTVDPQSESITKNQQKQTHRNLYATNGSLIKEFISKRDNFIDESSEKRPAVFNKYGFIAALTDGFNSDGEKRLEIALPDTADLSIIQNGGFSIFFWFLCKKQPGGTHRFIIKRGNALDELTPSVGILPNGTNLFVKIISSRHRIETLLSNKKIEPNRLYSLAATFAIDYNEQLTDISLFVDGILDSQISIPGEPLHNLGELWVGKPDSTSYGFIGVIADIILVPRVLTDEEVFSITQEGLGNINSSKGQYIGSYDIFARKFERIALIDKYTRYTETPIHVIQNLELRNEELREIVKKLEEDTQKQNQIALQEEQEELTNEDEKILAELKEFLQSEDSDNSVIMKKLAINSKFIYTVLFLANKCDDIVEAERIVRIFDILSETLHVMIDIKYILTLGQIFRSVYNKTSITLIKFFKYLTSCSSSLFQEMKFSQTDINQINIKHNEKKSNSFMKNGNGNGNGLIEMNSMELHENLLLNSQMFKNYIDDDNERELWKSSFVIKSLYSKPKTGTKRPLTGNEYGSNRGVDDGDLVGNLDDAILERDKDSFDEEDDASGKKEDLESEKMKVLVARFIDSILQKEYNSIKENNKLLQVENSQDLNVASSNRDGNIFSSQEVVSDLGRKIEFESPQSLDTNKMFMDPNNLIRLNEEEGMKESNRISQNEINTMKYPENWNEGMFEIVINHCYDCHQHKTTTRHYEYSFIDKFNEIGEAIIASFPNAILLGNYDAMEYLGCFDVYVRGIGPRLDEKGRYFLYKKSMTKKFPSTWEITDKLVALAMIYGSTFNIEFAQKQYLKAYSSSLPERSTISHSYPAYCSEKAEEIRIKQENGRKKPPQDDPERTKLTCLNWGCNAIYVKVENGPEKCTYHPGVWQFGSYNGYWPEAWSCCEKGWSEPGCTKGPHRGVRLDKRVYLCLNHGEPNPKTKHPNFACGQYYTIKEDQSCTIHTGYIAPGGTWSCCRAEKKLLQGCKEGKHATSLWPEEKAKLYFYPKMLSNPGLKYKKEENKDRPSVPYLFCKCDYFKDILKQYENPATKLALLKMKREKEKDEPRYCLNWACETVYKEPENHDKACRCHPGKWDHGSTGATLKTFIYEMNQDPKHLEKKTILWRPHWTCCRKDWNEPGCRRKRHRGPLLAELESYGKKYQWPDIRLKLHFTKVVSNKWKDFLQQYTYSPEKVKAICREFFSEGKKLISDIQELCDCLRLYLIVVNESPDYQMKYMDIASQSGTVQYFLVKDGSADKEKFVKWWFTDYITILEEMNPKPLNNPNNPQNPPEKK